MFNKASFEELRPYIPTHCPACNSTLELSQDLMHLKCSNPNCVGSLSRKIEIMCKAFGIDNIGTKMAKALCDTYQISNLVEFFELPPEAFQVGRYSLPTAFKFHDEVHKRPLVSLADFIRGCQIFRIGTGIAGDIAKAFKTLDEFMAATPRQLAARIPRVTTNLTEQMCEDRDFRKEEIYALTSFVTIAASPAEDFQPHKANIVITGSLSVARSVFTQEFEKLGFHFMSAVSKNTDILICDKPSSSSKAKKAQELGIKVMTEAEFRVYVSNFYRY